MKQISEIRGEAHQKLVDACNDIGEFGEGGRSCFGAVLCVGAIAVMADGVLVPRVYAAFVANDDAGPEYPLALARELRGLAFDLEERFGGVTAEPEETH